MRNIKNESDALKKEFERERKERNEAKKSQEQKQSRAADRDEMPCYKMDAKPRGISLSLFNETLTPNDCRLDLVKIILIQVSWKQEILRDRKKFSYVDKFVHIYAYTCFMS